MPDVTISSAAQAAPKGDGGLSSLAGAALQLPLDIINSAQSIHESRQNRRFQRDMSNTSHQREVADLQAAGLNPILSARYGGESTPSGSMPTLHSDAGSTLSSALALKTNVNLQNAQARDLNSSAALKELERTQRDEMDLMGGTEIKEKLRQMAASTALTDAQIGQVESAIGNLDAQAAKARLDAAHSAYGLSEASKNAEFWKSWGGSIAPWLKQVIEPLINDAATAAGGVGRVRSRPGTVINKTWNKHEGDVYDDGNLGR